MRTYIHIPVCPQHLSERRQVGNGPYPERSKPSARTLVRRRTELGPLFELGPLLLNSSHFLKLPTLLNSSQQSCQWLLNSSQCCFSDYVESLNSSLLLQIMAFRSDVFKIIDFKSLFIYIYIYINNYSAPTMIFNKSMCNIFYISITSHSQFEAISKLEAIL